MADNRFPPEILYVILAAIGGVAKYLNRFINGEKFSATMLLANFILSGFSGLMFSLFGKSLGLPVAYLYVLSGVGGFMSTEALKFLAQKIKKDL